VVQFYIDNRDTFVGIDLANDELKYDSLPFQKCFKSARDAGLRATAHSGEVY
jgi:adenosine deaminase